MPGRGRTTRRTAFTLIEVLVVVVIIGLAGAVVVPQMLQSGSMTAQAAARMVIADLLVAQNEAIAQQAPRRVVFDVEHQNYRVTDDRSQTVSASWKAGGTGAANYVVDLAGDSRFQGVRLERVDFAGATTVEFDALGAPLNGGTIELAAGAVRYRVRVAAMTGKVSVTAITGG